MEPEREPQPLEQDHEMKKHITTSIRNIQQLHIQQNDGTINTNLGFALASFLANPFLGFMAVVYSFQCQFALRRNQFCEARRYSYYSLVIAYFSVAFSVCLLFFCIIAITINLVIFSFMGLFYGIASFGQRR